jgi:predicted dehydrogenase
MSETTERRGFLKGAAAAAGGLLLVKPESAFSYQANSTVEVGIIGAGGRGNWIGPFFPEFAGARIVAIADVQKKNLDSTAEKWKIESKRAYYGPDAAKELANSKLDAIVIETPTYFHPEQGELGVNAGKHVYMAKPVAVDVPGCRKVVDSGKKAQQKGLSFWVDFQTRARDAYKEVATRVHRGDLGKPAFAQILYYAGRPVKDRSTPDMDAGQKKVINFFMDRLIGGDIIVEQNIHVIDVANWMLQGHPLKATGTGGRTNWSGTDYDAGDAYDHFSVSFWYPDDVHASFSSNQLTNSFSDLCVRIFGIHGCADTHYGGMLRTTGRNAWAGVEKDDTFKGGAIENVKAFIAAIKNNKPIYNFEPSVESNLTAILGRTAAYKQGEVTWDEMMKANEKWEAKDLKLRW